jgi:hypothetical protein
MLQELAILIIDTLFYMIVYFLIGIMAEFMQEYHIL